jgi:hypothetical protein
MSAYNANNSSFLHKLPPEVRMQIYEYALGGNTILFQPHHSICTDTCHPSRYRCRAHVAKALTEESGQPSDHDHEQVKVSQRRPENDWKRSGDVSLNLLLTCRQIYNEAVLVPSSNNDFGLNSNLFTSYNLTNILFLRDLIPEQIRAISTLHIRGIVRYGLVQQHIKVLSGLRRLKLSFDWNTNAIRHSPDLLMAAREDRFETSGVGLFAKARLQTVDFKIDLTVFLHDVQAVLAQEKELVDWVESKRAILLKNQTPVVSKRRAAPEAPQPLRTSARIRAQKEKAKASTEEQLWDRETNEQRSTRSQRRGSC